ncbi:hypothetical protein M5K25_014686 [Dendrobium thyrsiflorum]|uniref:Uncharacterized protein n=1 Tax=Dendrobium thyrsiflorum TaxID=117978 RepID=A0ABD0UNC7_DENTH
MPNVLMNASNTPKFSWMLNFDWKSSSTFYVFIKNGSWWPFSSYEYSENQKLWNWMQSRWFYADGIVRNMHFCLKHHALNIVAGQKRKEFLNGRD